MNSTQEVYFQKPCLRHQKFRLYLHRNFPKWADRFDSAVNSANSRAINVREVFVAGVMSGVVFTLLSNIARRLA